MNHSIDLAAIRARCDRATPGPWIFSDQSFGGNYRAFQGGVITARGCECLIFANDDIVFIEPSDACFIANARQDIPALLDEIDHWRKRAEALERALKHYDDREDADVYITCHTCVNYGSATKECCDGYTDRWRFDEARFVGGGDNA